MLAGGADSGADRDVEQIRGEFRDLRHAMTSGFNAMREDFADLRTHVDRRFAEIVRGFAEMRGKFDLTAAGYHHLADMLTTLIERQDDRPGGRS